MTCTLRCARKISNEPDDYPLTDVKPNHSRSYAVAARQNDDGAATDGDAGRRARDAALITHARLGTGC